MTRFVPLLAVLALPLAACGDDPAPVAEGSDDAAAQGEILGGSISDAMLPLDELESQSPPVAGEDDDADGDAGEDSDEDS